MLAGGVAAALVMVAPAPAAAHRGSPALQPVPSLTPAATARLWSSLVQQRHSFAVAADCRSLRAVFYAPTDWLRLATKLAANASPCAQYYISVPPLAADKTQPRSDQAWRIRALGPAFHALAEISVTGWTGWVATTGNSWYAAGVEARRRMTASGYEVSAGDTWALNELSSAVRQGVGNARANMQAFLNGLHDGDVLPDARGAVFIAGIGQSTADLSLYQARLQDWYEDAPFWTDLSRVTSDWSQELYGDVRNYAVPDASREARRDALNEYLQHQVSLAGVAPASGQAARDFLAATSSPLANAAWQYDASFGWTNVTAELMQDYVSAQVYAARSAGNSRFGFAWSPRNLAGMPTGDFNAQTDALLVRLAAAIADSADTVDGACGTTWCTRSLDGAATTTAWRTFGAWKPSRLAFTTPEQTDLARGGVGARDGRVADEHRRRVHGWVAGAGGSSRRRRRRASSRPARTAPGRRRSRCRSLPAQVRRPSTSATPPAARRPSPRLPPARARPRRRSPSPERRLHRRPRAATRAPCRSPASASRHWSR